MIIDAPQGPRPLAKNMIVAFFLLALSGHQAHSRGQAWPYVLGLHREFHFKNTSESQRGIDLNIYEKGNKITYNLKCHSSNYDSEEINYSGTLQCYLFSKTDGWKNLLSGSGESAGGWENRGRFLSNHLVHGCSEYKDWGSKREFFLRNMRISLAIKPIAYSGDKGEESLTSYDFSVEVVRDPTATSTYAARPATPQPSWFYDYRCPVSGDTYDFRQAVPLPKG